jgi:hypothetical protein
MKQEVMKEAYEHPRMAMRRIALEGSLAAPSPVKKVTLDEWTEVAEDPAMDDESLSFQVFN